MNIANLGEYVIEAMNSIISLADIETHELVHLNSHGEKFFNITKKDWEHQKYYKIFFGRDTQPSEHPNSELVEGKFKVWQVYIPPTNQYIQVHATIKEYNGRKMRFVIAHNITDKVAYAQSLENHITQTGILNSCLETLIKPLDISHAIHSLLEMLGNFYNADRIHIVHIKKEAEASKEIFEWAQKKDPKALQVLESLSGAEIVAWFKSYGDHDMIAFDSQESLDKSSGLFAQNGVSSFIAVPLRLIVTPLNIALPVQEEEQDIIGFIGIVNPRDNMKNKNLLRTISKFYENYYLKHMQTKNLYQLSHYDSMTELLNRNCYEEKYQELSVQNNKDFAVLYVDLNNLKYINDTKGHQAGDNLIRACAQVLKNIFEESVYRIGGDEFVALIENISKEKFDAKIQKLETMIAHDASIHISYGYIWNNGSIPIAEQIYQAEAMMYQNKKRY